MKKARESDGTFTQKASRSPGEIAKVTAIPAYLVINEAFRVAISEGRAEIAKVTAIFGNLQQQQGDDWRLQEIANVAR